MAKFRKTGVIETPTAKLSAEDIRNGWTEEKLKSYLNQRVEQQREYALAKKPTVAKVEDCKTFNPHEWRV